MRRFVRNRVLREVIAARHSGPDALLASFLGSAEKTEALEYWADKGCLELTRAWGGQIVSIALTSRGFTYFEDLRDERERFWRDRCVSFIGGFVAGVLTAVCSAVLIQRWL